MNNDSIQKNARTRWDLRLCYYFSISDDESFFVCSQDSGEREAKLNSFISRFWLLIIYASKTVFLLFTSLRPFFLQPLVEIKLFWWYSESSPNYHLLRVVNFLPEEKKIIHSSTAVKKKSSTLYNKKNTQLFMSVLEWFSETFS